MNRQLFKGILLIVVALLATGLSCGKPGGKPRVDSGFHRIISFAPSITETLFALGLGDRVVGVTRFCTYPPQVASLPKIGGYLDPNYEMILSLKPDLVLLLKEHGTLRAFLDKNSIRYVTVDNEKVGAILGSFTAIGVLCGVKPAADSLVTTIQNEMPDGTDYDRHPTVLFCIGRDAPGSGLVAKAYIAGPNTFYSELISMAGGRNVYEDTIAAYPALSGEGIARLAPDIIIDVMGSVSEVSDEKVVADWNCLSMVPAVKNGRVFSLPGDYMTIPGPRIGLILHDLKGIIGPLAMTADGKGATK